jgi:tRNA(Arg) A34 adenosine deaminase TadA
MYSLLWAKGQLYVDKYMQIAIDEARSAQTEGNYPYGSVLVRGKEVIGIGRNHMNTHNDPTSHAEIEVIRAAGLQETYADTVMYASAFPCIMCAGPIVMLGIPELVVGASWEGCESSRALMESNGVKITILELEECKQLLR